MCVPVSSFPFRSVPFLSVPFRSFLFRASRSPIADEPGADAEGSSLDDDTLSFEDFIEAIGFFAVTVYDAFADCPGTVSKVQRLLFEIDQNGATFDLSAAAVSSGVGSA